MAQRVILNRSFVETSLIKKNLSKKEVAQLIGCSPSCFSTYLSSRFAMRPSRREKLLKILSSSFDETFIITPTKTGANI